MKQPAHNSPANQRLNLLYSSFCQGDCIYQSGNQFSQGILLQNLIYSILLIWIILLLRSFEKIKAKATEFAVTFGSEVLFLCLFEIFLSISCTITFQFLRAADIYSAPFYLGHHKQLSDNKSHSLSIICYQKGSSRSTCSVIQDIPCFAVNAIKSFTKSASLH